MNIAPKSLSCSRSIRPCSHTYTWSRYKHGSSPRPSDHAKRTLAARKAARDQTRRWAILTALSIGATCFVAFGGFPRKLEAEAKPSPTDVSFERARRKTTSKEDNRDLISSQHLQVKKSWEHPGVYAWGSNTGRVVAPDSDEAVVKAPRRISFFNGQLLRGIKLDHRSGAAIAENGDLLQWGVDYSPDCRAPTPTLTGKDLIQITTSRDRIIALDSSGKIYSVPVAKADQVEGASESKGWLSFWRTSKPSIGYRPLAPADLSWNEKVTDISSGLEHCLILTSKGRLFTVASGSEDFPDKGQLGVPGLTWNTRPPGRYDVLHEVLTLNGFEIKKIAAGDYHSIALDSQGRVFSFGDNTHGQLGFDRSREMPSVDAPSLVPIDKLYKGTTLVPRVTHIAAGGVNSFFTVDATKVAGQGEEDPRQVGRITADTWASGQGIFGTLGNGRWTHVQGTPTKLKTFSGLFEYDEAKKMVVPIRLAHLSVGPLHAAAVMRNVTYLGATAKGSENDTNWGADILFWGGNEHYQLGNRKRNNVALPTYIPPLDTEAEKQIGRRELHRFQITPRHQVKLGDRWVSMEQRVECGRGCTAVYSGT